MTFSTQSDKHNVKPYRGSLTIEQRLAEQHPSLNRIFSDRADALTTIASLREQVERQERELDVINSSHRDIGRRYEAAQQQVERLSADNHRNLRLADQRQGKYVDAMARVSVLKGALKGIASGALIDQHGNAPTIPECVKRYAQAALTDTRTLPENEESRAKATKGKAGMAVGMPHVRRSTAGTGLRVGAADAVQPATSEIMDVTAGETAPNSECASCGGRKFVSKDIGYWSPCEACNAPVNAGSTSSDGGADPRDEGVTYAIDRLAKMIGAGEWYIRDGSETYDGDVDATIQRVLQQASMYDDETGLMARHPDRGPSDGAIYAAVSAKDNPNSPSETLSPDVARADREAIVKILEDTIDPACIAFGDSGVTLFGIDRAADAILSLLSKGGGTRTQEGGAK